ncbi:MAG: YbaB/EbfC family nucleoid-associated protein [Candidatus Fibromonas sp.]|nr:YbaB/EbfC family nucleoid-associated protein [Candidatus Fibromonas sp.]
MDMQQMIRSMQKMQTQMKKTQESLQSQNFSAEAGGGAVKVTINGNGAITELKIAPSAVDASDVEALEDLLMAAFNEAIAKKDNAYQESVGAITKGLKIPGMPAF